MGNIFICIVFLTFYSFGNTRNRLNSSKFAIFGEDYIYKFKAKIINSSVSRLVIEIFV